MPVRAAGAGGGSRRSRLAAVFVILLPMSLCLTPPTMYKQPPSLDREPLPHPGPSEWTLGMLKIALDMLGESPTLLCLG